MPREVSRLPLTYPAGPRRRVCKRRSVELCQPKRIGEQFNRVSPRVGTAPPLERTDRLAAECCSLGESLLRQTAGDAVPPQQARERGRVCTLHVTAANSQIVLLETLHPTGRVVDMDRLRDVLDVRVAAAADGEVSPSVG